MEPRKVIRVITNKRKPMNLMGRAQDGAAWTSSPSSGGCGRARVFARWPGSPRVTRGCKAVLSSDRPQ